MTALVAACASKGGDETQPNGNTTASQCTANAASIRDTVFKTSCDGAACHGAQNPAVGLDLVDTSPDQLMGKSSALCGGWSLIVPGSTEKSFLYQKLTATMPPCGDAMPLGNHLPADSAKCIADWIQGMGTVNGCETCGGSECVALASDAQHCGTCNNACPAGIACQNGACSCAGGGQACGGVCVDTATDPKNCGKCGNACGAGSSCAGGQCSCPAGLQACDSACVELQSDAQHCGACATACAAGEVCLAGKCASGCGSLMQCGTSCIDAQTSLLNCGGCDKPCGSGQTCNGGACACSNGGEVCGGSCVDTQTDPKNCGKCGVACGAGESCTAGACACVASSSVSFKSDIAPMLQSTCAAAGCHTGVKPKEGLNLGSSVSYSQLVGVSATQCGGSRKRVVAGSPSSSYLMQKLLNSDICFGTQMPKAGQTLPAKDLDAISGWICAGAQDN